MYSGDYLSAKTSAQAEKLKIKNLPTMSASKITWQAYNRPPEKHSPDWYWAVSIIALSIMITAVLLHNILFAVLVVISTISLFLRTLQEPRLITYELTNRGLWTNKTFEPWSTFEVFFVTDLPPSQLLMKSKSLTAPLSVIPLHNVDPDTVRDFLRDYLEERELQEPLAKRVMEYLRF
ncbi:MAG: hypothetical protein Q7R64_03240 [bacterium]|nr:hypothetical protein [bacterium]